jgi:hypothetical protein
MGQGWDKFRLLLLQVGCSKLFFGLFFGAPFGFAIALAIFTGEHFFDSGDKGVVVQATVFGKPPTPQDGISALCKHLGRHAKARTDQLWV